MTTPVPAQSPMFNHSILFKTIDDRDNMSDAELRYFIQNNFMAIMNNVFDRSVGVRYIEAFKDGRFLDAFIDVISNIQYFESDVVVRLNLLVYHYITSSEQFNKKPEIVHKMVRIASIINRYKAISLKKLHMPETLENYLLIARYSDFNMDVCVKRVNLMLTASPQVYSLLNIDPSDEASDGVVDWIANLLIELYRPDEWALVLPYFMLDVIPDNDGTPATEWITPEVEFMYSALNLAVLKILDSMIDTSNSLRGIMVTYAEGYRIMNNKMPIRFSFQTISFDYPRLKNCIQLLADEENIYVP